MRRMVVAHLCLTFFVATLAAIAAAQAKPAVASKNPGFSADVAGIQDGTPVSGKIYFMPERLRMEQSAAGTQTILIMDRTKKMLWIVKPGDKTYIEIELSSPGVSVSMPFPDKTGKPCAPMNATSCTRVGQETVNGRQCDRWELTTSGDKPVKTTLWLDPTLGAPIRWQTDAGDHYDFTNIKVGEQPESLFQVPAGYEKSRS